MESFPAVVGIWVGTTEAVILGNPPHHQKSGAAHQVRSSAVELTFRIEGQEGRRFWGVVESPLDRLPFVGVFGHDGRPITGVSSGGQMQGRLTDADTIEYCYARAGEVLVAACNTLKRR